MNLSEVILNFATKKLVRVDLPNRSSNQHEINGVADLKNLFGSQKVALEITWHYFSDNHDPTSEINSITFYDARAKSFASTRRKEWRMYYHGNFLARASEEDILVLAQLNDGYHGLIFQSGSSWLRTATEVFGLKEPTHTSFKVAGEAKVASTQLNFQRQIMLEAMGIEYDLKPTSSDSDLITSRFGEHMPTSKAMSEFSREVCEFDPTRPDETLTAWLEKEKNLFLALERLSVQYKIDEGFESVEDFIQFSLSVQNRRKARMGLSLQNHLEALFDRFSLRYSAQARTERKNRPDFIFPGEEHYRDDSFPAHRLTMLAAKSTAKDRWRQILTEADRIPHKHLCTIDSGISNDQINEMTEHRVKLVIPAMLASSYEKAQRDNILTVAEFIELVRKREAS